MSSSGLVADCPSSNRDLNEYGPSKAPLSTFSRPLPSARFPFHSASAFRVGINLLLCVCLFTKNGIYYFPVNDSLPRPRAFGPSPNPNPRKRGTRRQKRCPTAVRYGPAEFAPRPVCGNRSRQFPLHENLLSPPFQS